MEVFTSVPGHKSFFCSTFPGGSVVRDVLTRFSRHQDLTQDFYVVRDGHLVALDDPLQHGALYRLELRLRGGKGGFGSMLRALGAQIEKTTNREACRDLSGRRLRDVNHEKEMAEWLKKQPEREAEKEQRRLERLQKKLADPQHHFDYTDFKQQCHDLSERLEESVRSGIHVGGMKRASPDQSEEPDKKKKKAGKYFWTGIGEADLLSSDEEDPSPSTSSMTVKMQTQSSSSSGSPRDAEEPQSSCSSSHQREDDQPEGRRQPDDGEGRCGLLAEPPAQQPGEDGCVPGHLAAASTEAEGEDDDPAAPSLEQKKPDDPAAPSLEQKKPDDPAAPCLEQKKPDDPAAPCLEQKKPDAAVAPPADFTVAEASLQQLESLGLEVLKRELMSRGVKCGGTLEQRAARLLAIRDLKPEQMDPKLLAKPEKPKKK